MKPLILIIALVLGGCQRDGVVHQATYDKPYYICADTVSGHIYLTTQSGHGVTTVHAEHCQCKGGR